MESSAHAVALDGVVKRFGDATVLRSCSLTVAQGEFVSLLGPSGCGKTTLLRIIGGFLAADEGAVSVQGRRVEKLPPNKRPVNTVFQSYALFPHKNVAANVEFPLEIGKVPRRERAERVAEMLELVQLEHLRDRSVGSLSGGQAQRVALARALVGRPEVLLLDEPLAALDLKLRKAMQVEMRRIHDRLGTTFIYVTHDQEEALTMSDRIVLMRDGEIVQQGQPRAVYDQPANVFASGFLGEANLLACHVLEHANGTVRIELAGAVGTVRCARPPIAAGGEAVLSLRPERITLAGDSAAASANHLRGTARRVIFLGHSVRVLVALPDGLELSADLRREHADGIAEGQSIDLVWDAADGILLEPEQDTRAAGGAPRSGGGVT